MGKEQIEILDVEEKPKKKRKLKVKNLLILVFVLLIIIFVILFSTFFYLSSAISSDKKAINVEIKEGTSVYQVGTMLEELGLIRSSFVYKIIVKVKGVANYQAGSYELSKNMSTSEIIDHLYKTKGNSSYYKITFKEGKTIISVAKTIAQNTNITEQEVYNKLNDETYIDSLIQKYWFLTDEIKNKDIYYPLEGYLFPDTYYFDKNASLENIFDTMLNQTDKVFSKRKAIFDSSSYSIHELVTLASIVESEGIYPDDRKMIAGVFYNRLNAGMSLGSDVTTYYAFKIDMSERDLTKAEINTYNPYNTRGPKMAGKLPIGPISNFGVTSLDAALTPTGSDSYYFVADKTGKTHFTKTYEEHQKVIKQLKDTGNWIQW